MAEVIRRRWNSEVGSGAPHRDLRSCEYEAYIPDPLVGRPIRLDDQAVTAVVEAERALTELNLSEPALAGAEMLARLLLRTEALASARIEGLEIGGRRLLRAEVARDLGEESSDRAAAEVLGTMDAVAAELDSVENAESISVDHLLAMHRHVVAGTGHEDHSSHIRTEQNWIGGSSYNPCSAAFVPPPPEMVIDLLQDLCTFCNGESLPAIMQAALAHAQFETIHPFGDGNGRTGRALIHLILCRRGLATRLIVPVSRVLAIWEESYVDGLMATRYRGSAESQAAREGCSRWVALFAAACRQAAEEAGAVQARVLELEARWRRRLDPIRSSSSLALLLDALPGIPIMTIEGAAEILGRSPEAAATAIARLIEADILQEVKVGRSHRAFEAPEAIEIFLDLERQLAAAVPR